MDFQPIWKKAKGKTLTSNVVSIIFEIDGDVPTLTDSEEEAGDSLVADVDSPPTGTRLGKNYLKIYGQATESQPSLEKAKQKELKFDKVLKNKGKELVEDLRKSF